MVIGLFDRSDALLLALGQFFRTTGECRFGNDGMAFATDSRTAREARSCEQLAYAYLAMFDLCTLISRTMQSSVHTSGRQGSDSPVGRMLGDEV